MQQTTITTATNNDDHRRPANEKQTQSSDPKRRNTSKSLHLRPSTSQDRTPHHSPPLAPLRTFTRGLKDDRRCLCMCAAIYSR
jgi:hypothetical protein